MPAVDSFVGDGLAPSPYKEALAEIERLQSARGVQDAALACLRNDLRECAIRAERAEAECDALKADAERYRWLRERLSHQRCGPHVGWGTDTLLPGDDPDSAIDAARKEGEG